MNLKIRRSITGISCALLLTSVAAYAQTDDKPNRSNKMDRKDRMESHFKRIEKEIGITPEQEKKLEEHRKAHWEQAHQLFKQMKEKRTALEAEMEKPELNMAQINSLHADLKNIQDKLSDQRMEGILEVRKILTPDQFKKFHEMTKKDWKKGGRKGMGRGHGPDGDMGPGPDGDDAPPMK